MSSIITITQGSIGGETVQTVNARELHAYLEIGKDFSTWIKDRIDQYGFVENQDFVCSPVLGSEGRGGHNRKDYHLSIDMAKELSMVERNDKGKAARQYFIECERQAKELSSRDPMDVLNDPSAMRGLLLTYSEKVLALEEKVEEQAPKVRALDRIASPTEGAVGIRIAAKLLQMPERQFTQFANAEGYIFRHHHSRVWQGYADKAKAGLVEQKFTTIIRDDGSEKTVEQVLFTRLGIAKLAEKLERRNLCATTRMTKGLTADQSRHSATQL